MKMLILLLLVVPSAHAVTRGEAKAIRESVENGEDYNYETYKRQRAERNEQRREKAAKEQRQREMEDRVQKLEQKVKERD